LQPAETRSDTAAQQRFLDGAADLFARNGYHATSIRDIARALGVTPGAVYAHFPSKARILLAVYEAGVTTISQAVDQVMCSGGTPWTVLEQACHNHLEAVLADNGYARVVVRVVPEDVAEVADDLARLRAGYEARFRQLVDALDLVPGTNRTLLRFTLLGALNWSQVWYRPGLTGPGDIAREIVRSLKDGVAAKGTQT
jgi:AcrR family transcriptional regulator